MACTAFDPFFEYAKVSVLAYADSSESSSCSRDTVQGMAAARWIVQEPQGAQVHSFEAAREEVAL